LGKKPKLTYYLEALIISEDREQRTEDSKESEQIAQLVQG
jgi:hypothetical protein